MSPQRRRIRRRGRLAALVFGAYGLAYATTVLLLLDVLGLAPLLLPGLACAVGAVALTIAAVVLGRRRPHDRGGP